MDEKTYSTPPLVDAPHPLSFLSRSEINLLTEHYRIVATSLAGQKPWPEEKLNSAIGPDGRKKVTGLLATIRASGYYLNGIDKQGTLCFGQARKSRLQMEMEKGLPPNINNPKFRLSDDERDKLIHSCRSRFHVIFEKIEDD